MRWLIARGGTARLRAVGIIGDVTTDSDHRDHDGMDMGWEEYAAFTDTDFDRNRSGDDDPTRNDSLPVRDRASFELWQQGQGTGDGAAAVLRAPCVRQAAAIIDRADPRFGPTKRRPRKAVPDLTGNPYSVLQAEQLKVRRTTIEGDAEEVENRVLLARDARRDAAQAKGIAALRAAGCSKQQAEALWFSELEDSQFGLVATAYATFRAAEILDRSAEVTKVQRSIGNAKFFEWFLVNVWSR
jgi:hypothetical protein